jgi:TetR/AcrR family transcriptional regulator, fatty acid metabolism regulator protein
VKNQQSERAKRAREKRRKQLLDAATTVFARKGYWAASISDIIQVADVARGSFYRYFQGKQEIFVAIVDRFREQERLLVQQLDELTEFRPGENFEKRVRVGILSWLELYHRNLAAAKIVLRDANMIDPSAARKREDLRREVRAALVRMIVRRQEAGLYRRRISPELTAHFLLGMFDEIAANCLDKAKQADLPSLAEQFVEFELNGLLLR